MNLPNPFRCRHKRLGWPRKRGKGHTVTCLDCWKTLEYDWNSMAVVNQKRVAPLIQRESREVK